MAGVDREVLLSITTRISKDIIQKEKLESSALQSVIHDKRELTKYKYGWKSMVVNAYVW